MRGHIKIACLFLHPIDVLHMLPGVVRSISQGGRCSREKGKRASPQFIVACSPEKPIARPGETIRLKTYVASPAGKPLKYSWSALAGRVDGQGPEVLWDFTDVNAGIYEAKVRVSDGGSRNGRLFGARHCAVSVSTSDAWEPRNRPVLPRVRRTRNNRLWSL